MPNFKYKAIDRNGNIVKGMLSAFDERDLELKLSEKGLILVQAKRSKDSIFLRFGRISPKLIIEFYSRLYQALEIGLPILSALYEIAQGLPSKLMKRIIEEIAIAVEAGNSLYDAMVKYTNIFSRLELNVIKMGEKSGTLPLCLKELADFLEWKEELKSTVKRAMIYPGFVIVMVFAVSFVWIGYVLPNMAKMLLDMGVRLPTITMIILNGSMFLKSHFISILSVILFFIVLLLLFIKLPITKPVFHRYILRLPIIGNVIFNTCLTRLSNNFAIMYRAGVTISDIFEILIDNSLGNRYLENQLSIAFQKIQAGQSISEAFEELSVFPRLFVGAVRNGEVTGTLDESFRRLKDYYDREVKNRVEMLVNALEPITMLILGIIFGIVVLSILFPLYDLISSISGKV